MEISRKNIPYSRQWIDEEDIQVVVDVLKSDYLTTGPKISEFEEAICRAAGAKYAVAVSNGTAALHAACFAAGLGEGDEVITSPMTFAASANCVLYMGAKPIFADIEKDTYNISPDDIRRKVTKKTKAIIPVHFTGQPCRMDEILDIAHEYNLMVIEDGAHALGAEYRGKKIGSIGNMTTFSFHPVKNITTGEGGAITTNSKQLYDKLVLFRSHGITRDVTKLEKEEGAWYYEQHCLGYNYRMTDIQASLGISQLKKLDMFLEKRRKYAAAYNIGFKDLEGIIIPHQLEEANSAWHLYIIQLGTEKLAVGRRAVFDALRQRNIGVNVHYIPVYYHPHYRKLGYEKGICPEAEKLYERIVTLPLFPGMEQTDVEYITDNVKDIVSSFSLDVK